MNQALQAGLALRAGRLSARQFPLSGPQRSAGPTLRFMGRIAAISPEMRLPTLPLVAPQMKNNPSTAPRIALGRLLFFVQAMPAEVPSGLPVIR